MFAFYLLITIVPQEILQHYTFDGRIQLQPLYAHAEKGDSIKFKNANLQAIHEGKKAQIWSRENIEASQEIYRKDIMKGIYGIEVNMTNLIKEYMIEQVFIYVKEITIIKNIHTQWRRTRWCHWCHGTTCFLVSKYKKVSKSLEIKVS